MLGEWQSACLAMQVRRVGFLHTDALAQQFTGADRAKTICKPDLNAHGVNQNSGMAVQVNSVLDFGAAGFEKRDDSGQNAIGSGNYRIGLATEANADSAMVFLAMCKLTPIMRDVHVIRPRDITLQRKCLSLLMASMVQRVVQRLHVALTEAPRDLCVDWHVIAPTAEWRKTKSAKRMMAPTRLVFIISPSLDCTPILQREIYM